MKREIEHYGFGEFDAVRLEKAPAHLALTPLDRTAFLSVLTSLAIGSVFGNLHTLFVLAARERNMRAAEAEMRVIVHRQLEESRKAREDLERRALDKLGDVQDLTRWPARRKGSL